MLHRCSKDLSLHLCINPRLCWKQLIYGNLAGRNQQVVGLRL